MMQLIKTKIKKFYFILKHAWFGFIDDNVISLCASLSFYTLFSLPPLLMVMIALSGIFFGTDAVQGRLFYEIQVIAGEQLAIQIQEIIKNLKLQHNNSLIALTSTVIFFFGASGVFSEIQSGIHIIWKIESKHESTIRNFLKLRFLSFLMIGSVSFLLIVSLVINALLDIASKRLELFLKDSTVLIFQVINSLFVLVVITVVFMLIFKTLHDKKMKWKYVFVAAFSSTILFMTGKYLISLYLTNSIVISIYGAAGSLIMLMVWIYYSAAVLYISAEIAKAYAYSNDEFELELTEQEIEELY
jgi:membrane protein